MSIRATIEGLTDGPVVLNAVKEDDRGFFWLHSAENVSIGLEIPYPYGSKPDYDCSETEVILLLNPFQGEAAVLEVRIVPGAQRLGYVFSLTSIGSVNHQYAENKYFRKACYAATLKAIETLIGRDFPEIDVGTCRRTCALDDLLGGDLTILTVHRPFALKAGVTLSQLNADLHRYGYTLADWESKASPLRLGVVKQNFLEACNTGRLSIRPTCALLSDDSLIARFLCKRISCPEDPVLRFFYLYQVVERILEFELVAQSKTLLAELSARDLRGLKIMGAFHEFKDKLSEKTRLKSLFESRTSGVLQNSPTLDHLKAFLRVCQVDDAATYWENFYKVRNVVFHAWWSAPDSARSDFALLVAGVENDIAELVVSYTPIAQNP
jgi:hypothetical protein